MILLVLLTLGVAWDTLRAVAWHGWAALEIYVEIVLALVVLAVVAGARADTAKAVSTEHRVNEMNRRNWTAVRVQTEQISNSTTPGPLSVNVPIPAGTAEAGSEYEIYVDGDGTWGGNNPTLWVSLAGATVAPRTLGDPNVGPGSAFTWWVRVTLSVRTAGAGGVCAVVMTGELLPAAGNAHHDEGYGFGSCVWNRPINTTIANSFNLAGQLSPTPAGTFSSYKTRVSRRAG